MPHSSEVDMVSDVASYLREALPGSTVDNVELLKDYPPVLILRFAHILAAFAFASESVEAAYEVIYPAFKRHFTTKLGQWDSLDVSFVYCVPPEFDNLDFCSRTETNVYFCRKFVVPVREDVRASLARIPFLPLQSAKGTSLRPPSAQTFLKQCDVPAELAKFIVVGGERSPEGILQDCVTDKFGPPIELTGPAAPASKAIERAAAPVTLSSVTVKNFRAYRRERTFTLGKSITVLYGPNGFGKTSLFDAIDFAVTGGIGRIPTRSSSTFSKTARHLDSGDDASFVQLDFQVGEIASRLSRSVEDPNQAQLDARPANRKTVLNQLTGGSGSTDRIEHLISLFRATHLFSQEQQELTRNFQEECQLPSDIVSRMLAFEDYVSALSKTAEVEKAIQTVVSTCSREAQRLGEQIAFDQAELTRLEAIVATNTDVGTLEPRFAALRDEMTELGLSAAMGSLDVATLRQWRTLLETAKAESASSSERLEALRSSIGHVATLLHDQATLRSAIADLEKQLANIEPQRLAVEQLQNGSQSQLLSLRRQDGVLRQSQATLAWVSAVKQGYDTLKLERDQLAQSAAHLLEEETKLRNEEASAEATKTSRDTGYSAHSQELLAATQRAQTLNALAAKKPDIGDKMMRLEAISNAERALVLTLETLRSQANSLRSDLDTARLAVEAAQQELAQSSESANDLKALVMQIRGHVHREDCPVCGEHYSSTDELLQRIDDQLRASPNGDIEARLAAKRSEHSKLSQDYADVSLKIDAADANRSVLQQERVVLETALLEFSRETSSLGFASELSASVFDQIESTSKQAEEAIGSVQQRTEILAQERDMSDRALAAAQAARIAKSAEVTAATKASERLGEALRELQADPRRGQISLDQAGEDLTTLTNDCQQQLAETAEKIAAAQSSFDLQKSQLTALADQVNSARRSLQELRPRESAATKGLAEHRAALSQLGLPEDATEEVIAARLGKLASRLALEASLLDRAKSLEIGLDVATTAAALTSLRAALNAKLDALTRENRRRTQYESWADYFKRVAQLLSAQQNAATVSFTKEYGPRTAVIQRRLRPVYGFDDLTITSHAGAINVRVTRNGEPLRPTDYFSQSQQQTLLLGLFLTACSSQTWSAFSPILLDDPVTHFDDLNTYALLDLISGLIQSSEAPRQFVVSTCDEKLLQLARQKFAPLKTDAKFYRFSAIGAEGPMVSELPQT